MERFNTFQTNKASKFLNKAKNLKNNREADVRRSEAILKMQKNMRAFLEYIRNAHNYPHMLRSLQSLDPNHLHQFWTNYSSQPKIIQDRFAHLSFQQIRGNPSVSLSQEATKALLSYSLRNNLRVDQYHFLIQNAWNSFSSDYLCESLRKKNFCIALEEFVRSNIHRLVEMILRVNDFATTQEIIRIFFENSSANCWRAEKNETEEQVLRSFYNFTAILSDAIKKQEDTSLHVKLMSTIIKKLKSYYSEQVIRKYSIPRQMLSSSQLKQQVEEFISEKEEWQEYISHLHPLLSLVPVIMRQHLSKRQDIMQSSLDILIELTNSNQTLIKIDLSAEEFIALIERLTASTSEAFTHQQHHSLGLVKVILGEKYLQNLNDLKFIRLFQYQKRRLGHAIENNLIKYMRSLIGLPQNQSLNQQVIKHSVALCRNLYNKIFRTCLLSTKIFEDKTIQFLQSNRLFTQMGNANNFKQLQEMVERCPFLLSIQTRFIIFRKMVSQMNHYYLPGVPLTIKRNRDFEDAIRQLYNRDIRSRFQVRFVDEFGNTEGGIDAGGLTKQFLTRVFKAAFDPKQRRFIENDKKQLIPNPEYYRNDSGKMAQEYEFIGRLIGKSLVQNIMLGVKFAGPFLNLLINNRNSFDDLLHIDVDLYKSLIYIAEMETGVEQLELTFAYHDNLTNKVINLKPRGEKVKVTNENKAEYIDLLVNYKVNRSIETQTRHIRKGLKSVINDEWLKAFNYAEFSYLLSGAGKIDVNDWMKHTKVIVQDIDQIKRFWDIVSDFSEEEKSLLLKFVTSCERPSFLGFKDLSPPFTVVIHQASDSKLPISHTCSNTLELPSYPTAQMLREKLLYAIRSASGFQMA